MTSTFKVIDLFAGPGGLAEGFSSVSNDAEEQMFEIALSVEKDDVAHATLRLRAFTRQFPLGGLPEDYYAFGAERIELEELKKRWPVQWAAAEREAKLIELGTRSGNRNVNSLLRQLRDNSNSEFIVIGGPPCQAYSLVGRARNKGITGYRAEKDPRHYLYREYIKILGLMRPAAFVMENVKGMLSSEVDGKAIFRRVRSDLERAGGRNGSYRLLALSPCTDDLFVEADDYADRDFVIRSEDHDVPQARHRVIILGLRSDLFERLQQPLSKQLLPAGSHPATVRDVISDLPVLRSTLSQNDDPSSWEAALREQMALVCQLSRQDEKIPDPVRKIADETLSMFRYRNSTPEHRSTSLPGTFAGNEKLAKFLLDPRLEGLRDHEARGHMVSDLGRDFFASCFANAMGRSPKASEFPAGLAPKHANWTSGRFADRFRVQSWDKPATTVVSHISKDGHYYIHPDPMQCRSLTPREAARLQTFPDNYIFLGNRTQRYHQIGNAVPPYLAKQIAEVVRKLLVEGGRP